MQRYDWNLHPQAEMLLSQKVQEFVSKMNPLANIKESMFAWASLRLFDWIDHMVLPLASDIDTQLKAFGYEKGTNLEAPDDTDVLIHPNAIFFPILLSNESYHEIALKPENLDHFVQMTGKGHHIEGGKNSSFRRSVIHAEGIYTLSAVERRGYSGFLVHDSDDVRNYNLLLDRFSTRTRQFVTDEEGISLTMNIVSDAVSIMNKSRVADAFFKAERRYWESRDWAGQVQRNRQDRLGLGWGNHDHHTYRSSRNNFATLISIFEKLGFETREQFFAGTQAGWGAQVLEHPVCNIVIFADVDISEEERGTNFARKSMTHLEDLGTVGMWVSLHGEGMLQGGLHHLAARVHYENTREMLPKFCAAAIRPFSYFDFLKQSFTESERRMVDPSRVSVLLQNGVLSEKGGEMFLDKGAIGSHLEIIERRQGFKGFNQDSVTAIIQATDPRKGND
ncbi:MAG: hypothetical protein P1Q69_07240 [Candidatus Thorarchaeota archaeon]|nr:hypothetical protein [Candidatus Thorarchaeota archaeon]